jgi:hypothetical protein
VDNQLQFNLKLRQICQNLIGQVAGFVGIGPAEPVQQRVPVETRLQLGQVGLIGRMWIYPKVVHKAVLLRIGVDVIHQLYEIIIVVHADASEWFFKQSPGAVKRFVDGLGITVEQFGKLVADAFGNVGVNVGRVWNVGWVQNPADV